MENRDRIFGFVGAAVGAGAGVYITFPLAQPIDILRAQGRRRRIDDLADLPTGDHPERRISGTRA